MGIALAWTAGIVAWYWWSPPTLALLAGTGLVLATAYLVYRHGGHQTAILLLAGFLLAGWMWTGVVAEQNYSQVAGDLHTHLYMTGTVLSSPLVYPDRVVYLVRAQQLQQSGWERTVSEKIQVIVWQDSQEQQHFRYGDRIRIYGRLELPTQARNPGEFNYRAYLWRRGIMAQMAVAPGALQLVEAGRGNLMVTMILAAKDRAVQVIQRGMDPTTAGVLQAILFGDKAALDIKQGEIFRNLGVSHLFSVSGTHVGLVVATVLILAGRLPPAVTLPIVTVVVLVYATMAGFSSSVSRSALMALVALGSRLVGRERDYYSALAMAALVLLVVNPFVLADPGFQLSFLAAGGLVYLTPLGKFLPLSPRWQQGIGVAAAALISTLPLSAYYFNLLPILALPVNLLTLAVFGVVVNLGLMLVILAQFWQAASLWLAAAIGSLLAALINLMQFMASWPGGVLRVGTPLPAQVAGWYLLIAGGRQWLLYPAWRRWSTGLAAVAVTLVMVPWLAGNLQGNLEITFLDVGQGDAIFIKTPGGRHLLVDGGNPAQDWGAGDRGEMVVLPFLRHRGVDHLDLMINTHPHLDHIGGLPAILQGMQVRSLAFPMLPAAFIPVEQRQLAQMAELRRLPVLYLGRGDQIVLEPGLEINVLHPGEPLRRTRSDANNNSLVISLVYGQFSLLLTGDIETEAMENMFQAGISQNPTVYKISHHGSGYALNRDLLDRLTPAAVVVSVGEKNSFGHPAANVLDYWQQRQIPLYRTDRDGAVSISSDGQRWWLNTVIPATSEPAA